MELFCSEARIIRQGYRDHVFLDDTRVLHNLLETEERYTISSSYYKCLQTELKPYMRKVVALWMLEVCEEERCQEEVFPLAMNYLDRFLSIVQLRKSQLQLLGTVCLLLASKMRQVRPICTEKLCLYTDNSVTLQEIMEWEVLVLSRLKWDLAAITPIDFLEHILRRMPPRGQQQASVRRHAQTFIALCAADFKFSMYPPSMIAAASVGAALQGLMRKDEQWTQTDILVQLHVITSIEVDCLKGCLEQIEEMLSASLNQSRHQSPSGGGETQKTMDDIPVFQSGTPTDVQDVHF